MPSVCSYGPFKNINTPSSVLVTKSGEQDKSGIHSNDVFPISNPFEYVYLVQDTKSSDQFAHFMFRAFLSISNHIIYFCFQ